MKFDQEILQSFLWETHGIEKGLQIRKAIREGSFEDNIELSHALLLQNTFLYRRVRDPGFFQYVTAKVERNGYVLEKTCEHIYQLLSRHVYEDDFFSFSPAREHENEHFPENFQHGLHFPMGMDDFFDAYTSETRISLDYLLKRQEFAMKNELEDETAVISYLIEDFKTGKDFTFTLLPSGGQSSLFKDNARWHSEQMRYFYENINWPERYISELAKYSDETETYEKFQISPYDFVLFKFLPCGSKARNYFSEKFGIPFLPASESKDIQEVIRNWKFSTDALSIASEKWFTTLSEEEKIALLNGSYEFSLDERHMAVISFPYQGLYGNALFQQGYFNEAKQMYESGLKLSKCDEERYSFVSNLATVYRELGDYHQALACYEQAYEYSKKLRVIGKKKRKGEPKSRIRIQNTRNPKHRQAIELLNVAEMRIQVGDEQKGMEELETVKAKMRRFSLEERAHLISKLVCLNRRVGDYLNEYRYLKELRTYEGVEFSPELEMRWTLLTMPKTLSEGFLWRQFGDIGRDLAEGSLLDLLGDEQATKPLREIEAREKAERYMYQSSAALGSFRFEKSLTYALKAIEAERHPHLLSETAHRYIELEQYASASALLDEAISLTSDSNLVVKCMTFQILINLEQGNTQKATATTLKTINYILENLASTEEKKALIAKMLRQVSKTLINKRSARPLLTLYSDLEEHMVQKLRDLDVAELLSSSLLSVFALDEAQHYIDSLLSRDSIADKDRAYGLMARGRILSMRGDHEEAIKSYTASRDYFLKCDQGIKDPLYPELHAEMAYSYGILMDLANGLKCIEIACNITPGNQHYIEIREKYMAFLKSKLAIQSIRDPECRKIFNMAELLALEVYGKVDEKKEFDFAPAAIEYAKGLEMLLFTNIQPAIRETIIKEFRIKVYQDLEKKSFRQLPFKYAFNPDASRQVSITPTQWRKMKLFADKNEVENRILQVLEDSFGNRIAKTIFDACEAVELLDRNGAAHTKVKTKSEVLDKRTKIIEPLNALIQTFYSDDHGVTGRNA